MPKTYLHNLRDFNALLRIVGEERNILPGLVEKDYWIMHVLYGLKKMNYEFELKGGTSLSKGYGIIDRFSEDIDIHIKPPVEFKINENPNNIKPATIESRKNFYEWLSRDITIDGIIAVERDTVFDDVKFRSGGIRLFYNPIAEKISGIKEGILLEAGFDDVTPNHSKTISSWAYDKAITNNNINILDNRANDIICYDQSYTFVEKLQTIATKFRKESVDAKSRPSNFMRQYYDVYCLLANAEVQEFIGTKAYETHKKRRFPKIDFEIPIAQNEAFLLNDKTIRADFEKRYKETESLYYNGQPPFEELLKRIRQNINRL